MADFALAVIRTLLAIARASRASQALLLLGVLVLGTALHGLHHLQDPHCADGRGRDGHACVVCAGLHGSTLAATEQVAPAPHAREWLPAAPARPAPPRARAIAASAPRAPPAS